MQGMKTVLALVSSGVFAAALCGTAVASDSLRPAKGLEPLGSPQWPAVAAQLAKNLAKDSFGHQYAQVWAYLHPSYQHAVSQAHWNRCQGAHPAAPRQVTVTKVSVAKATELPIDLSLIGRRNVQDIELQIRFTSPAAAGTQLALLETFWLKDAGTWRAVWLSDEYAAYKTGKCYVTPQGPPLY